MASKVIQCDRCDQYVQGTESVTGSGSRVVVGWYEFYDSDGEPTIWEKYSRPGEERVCYKCVRSTSEFTRDYPHIIGWEKWRIKL